MAGSFRHATDDYGRLVSNRHIGVAAENLGDAYETIEEMYGMIWYLADGDIDRVERARRNYKKGISMSPGKEPEDVHYEDEDEG